MGDMQDCTDNQQFIQSIIKQMVTTLFALSCHMFARTSLTNFLQHLREKKPEDDGDMSPLWRRLTNVKAFISIKSIHHKV